MSDPLITIVTPSYNQGVFLERNLRSVIDQNYPNVEHWVLDGGSTDQSTDILARYAATTPHLHWLSARDRGQSDAVNKGFHRATGEIVGWINSDDALAPGALRKVADFFAANPQAQAVVGDLLVIDADDKPLATWNATRYTHELLLSDILAIAQPSSFFRRSLIERAGDIDISLHYAMDHEYFMRITQFTPIEYLPEVLAYFRLQPDSKTMSEGMARCSRDNLQSLRRHGGSILASAVGRNALYVVLTQPLRRIPWLRASVRSLKRRLGMRGGENELV